VLADQPRKYLEFLNHLLLQLCRHLTAYDLVTFHHRGANYPDALLLDAALKAYLRIVDQHPQLFQGIGARARLHRRALWQGVLMRRRYEGHLVPAAPTSPGENARVMPSSHPRVPEDELLQPHRRSRKLFAGEPIAGLLSPQALQVLQRSLDDLVEREEWIELGLGVFIDRPLGYAKAVGEPDQTPLFAYHAFSPSLARRRWQELARLGEALQLTIPARTEFVPEGLPHTQIADCPRPVAAVSDVRRVADDFIILRMLSGGWGALRAIFDWHALSQRYRLGGFMHEVRWCVQALDEEHRPVLALFDKAGRRRLEMRVDASQGYRTRAGVEYPVAGLEILTVWEDTDNPKILQREAEKRFTLPPRV
jgi:hypothetical protein